MGVHRRALLHRDAAEADGLGPVAVIGLEQRQLEVGVAAGGAEEVLLGAHQRVAVLRRGRLAARGLHVAQRDQDLGQRQVPGGLPVPPLGGGQVAAGDGDGAETGLGPRVGGQRGERVLQLDLGLVQAAQLDQQRGVLHARPLRALAAAGATGDRVGHQVGRARQVALQLQGVRLARVGDERRPLLAQLVDGPEGLRVLAELDLRVADDGLRSRREAAGEADRLLAELQRLREVVARQGERAEPDDGVEAGRLQRAGAAQQLVGAGVVARVARLAGPLQVGEPQPRDQVRIVGAGLHRRLQLGHLAGRADHAGERIDVRPHHGAGRGPEPGPCRRPAPRTGRRRRGRRQRRRRRQCG